MADKNAINLSGENSRLKIATATPALGLLVKEDLHLAQPETVEIDWGVEQYPGGAAWHRGHKKEAVMVVLFFGDPLPSPSIYLPDMPLFLGLFLGEHEPVLNSFVSENYPESGRYVCLGNPSPGQRIVSRLDLRKAFRDWFGNRPVPPLTGIAIEVDTRNLVEDEGISSAFIHHIGLKKAN